MAEYGSSMYASFGAGVGSGAIWNGTHPSRVNISTRLSKRFVRMEIRRELFMCRTRPSDACHCIRQAASPMRPKPRIRTTSATRYRLRTGVNSIARGAA
jgi:hypothetical protein